MRVNRVGSARLFSKIGATIGVAEKASANILAQANLVDVGYGVTYDNTRDWDGMGWDGMGWPHIA